MALKVVKVESSPQKEILTDLTPGKPRKTIYGPLNPWTAAIIGASIAPLAIGAGRLLFGKSDRDEAREHLQDKALDLKIAKEEAELEKTYTMIDLLRQPVAPPATPLQEQQIEVLRESLPLDLARKKIDIERVRTDLEERERLFPLKEELQREAMETSRALRAEREARLGEFMKTEQVLREKALVEKGVMEQKMEALREERERIKEALAPLPWWERSSYLREKYYPEEERKRKQAPGTRVVRAIGHGVLQFGEFGGP